VADLAADPQDEDAVAALRLAVRKALGADPVLAEDVRWMLPGAGAVTQRVRGGRDSYTAGRDQTVVQHRHPGE
jgi:hypothetical protein